MPQQNYQMGDSFRLQFVWQVPSRDYVRALFQVEITSLDLETQRYIVQIQQLLGKRQETAEGEARPAADLTPEYWQLVRELVGRKAAIAYEASSPQPIRLRYETLTREHHYFTRYK